MLATRQALEDLKTKTIRPTKFESGAWDNYEFDRKGLFPKLVIKAIRLKDEFLQMYDQGRIERIEDWEFQAEGLPIFFIALHLNKAFERGDREAERFFIALLQAGSVRLRTEEYAEPDSIRANNPYELAKRISVHFINHGDGKPFLFDRPELNVESVDMKDTKVVGHEDDEKYEILAEKYAKQKGEKVTSIAGVADYSNITNYNPPKTDTRNSADNYDFKTHRSSEDPERMEYTNMEAAFYKAMGEDIKEVENKYTEKRRKEIKEEGALRAQEMEENGQISDEQLKEMEQYLGPSTLGKIQSGTYN